VGALTRWTSRPWVWEMTDRGDAELARIARRIWASVSQAGFQGSDPYDGLNSQLLAPVLSRSRLARLVVIQAVKRSPVDLRPLLRIPVGLNPKGLALMLQGAAEWSDLGSTVEEQSWLCDALVCLASGADGGSVVAGREVARGAADSVAQGTLEWPQAVGWGYNFAWQSKAFLQPAYSPTVVATSFIVDGLQMADSSVAPVAIALAGRFVANCLNRHEDADGVCFSYSPDDHTRVYNASLFGARVLAQAAEYVPEKAQEWLMLAKQATNWVMSRQKSDGSWLYGEAAHWHWIDNLHTGFNLETIQRISQLLGTSSWDDGIARGLAFYRANLFEADATPRYYTTRKYPLDPHSFAQGAITFLRLAAYDSGAEEFAREILLRCVAELWDDGRGGVCFQKHRGYSQGTIHMRWSQAWMFRALCAYLSR